MIPTITVSMLTTMVGHDADCYDDCHGDDDCDDDYVDDHCYVDDMSMNMMIIKIIVVIV